MSNEITDKELIEQLKLYVGLSGYEAGYVPRKTPIREFEIENIVRKVREYDLCNQSKWVLFNKEVFSPDTHFAKLFKGKMYMVTIPEPPKQEKK